MSDRVDVREWVDFQWPYLMQWLGGEERVERLAYETGAFTRRRKITRPGDLLQLLLLWAAGGHPLRETAVLAAAGEVADVSDVALLKRFAKCDQWVMSFLSEVITDGCRYDGLDKRLRLIDATIVASAGKRRHNDHRIHLSYNARAGRIDHVELTSMKGGEDLTRFEFAPSDVVIADRGYGRAGGIRKVADAGAQLIVRVSWQNLPLEHPDGTRFDVMEALRSLDDARADEFSVCLRGDPNRRVYRFVAIRKSEPKAAASRRKLATTGRKDRRNLDTRSLEAAGYVFVLTNLDQSVTAEQVLELYQLRWQVEIRFKSLKSVIHLDQLPVRNFELAQTYLAAKLLVAVLIEQLLFEYDSFPPWGYPLQPAFPSSFAQAVPQIVPQAGSPLAADPDTAPTDPDGTHPAATRTPVATANPQ